jgi:hypothetical protein
MIRFWFLQAAFLAAALFTCRAHAEPSEADRATARELANAGYHALKRGDYATAADHFGRADALVHAPTLVVDWGRALAGLGFLVEAGEKYALVLREGVGPESPPSWHRAHVEARSEFEALQPRLAWLTLVVRGPDGPTITVDRERMPDAALGVPRATNPGTHEIRVRAPGHRSEARSITLVEGEQKRLEIARSTAERPRRREGAATGGQAAALDVTASRASERSPGSRSSPRARLRRLCRRGSWTHRRRRDGSSRAGSAFRARVGLWR